LSNPQLVEAGVSGEVGGELIGGHTIGQQTLGGGLLGSSGTDTIIAYPFFTRIKIQTPKFRTRRLTFIARDYGYLAIEMEKDFDIMIYEQRIPSRFRQKQYVAKDGIATDLPSFDS
jgi:hypothetical protein